MKVHFLGIGGSGLSGTALIAKSMGYDVTGCDKETKTAYIGQLLNSGITVFEGHDEDHVKDADILAVTPAVFFEKSENPEVVLGKKQNKLSTWQAFLGKYLHQGKIVVSVAGTHGKSTTTAMLGKLLENANLDPLVMIGANVDSWGGNARIGKGDFFVTESDEFYDNYLNYYPDTIILNNIEFDHPDYFKDEDQYLESFARFINQLTKSKTLIYNPHDEGIKKLLQRYVFPEINKVPYDQMEYKLGIPGKHNIANSRGVITFARLHNISNEIVEKTLADFSGIGRRLELIGTRNGVLIYDDYAHHPTAIGATLEALKEKHPTMKITAIVEPHTFSRTKAVLPLYTNAFVNADKVIIAPIYKSRDQENFGISQQSIVDVVGKKAFAMDSFEKIIQWVKEHVQSNEVVVVMGAGKSYDLSRNLLEKL